MAVEKLPANMINGTVPVVDEAARYDAMLLAFRNQMLSGRVFDGMVQGMSDAFEDESGVDGVTSVNQVYDVTDDFFTNNAAAAISQIPAMTGYTTPTGTVTAESYRNTYYPWRAFDGATPYWVSDYTTTTWAAYDFGVGNGKTIAEYIVGGSGGFAAGAPNSWRFEGWNGSGWDILDLQSAQTFSGNEDKTFTVASPASYEKYRLYILSNNGDASTMVRKIQMFEAGAFLNTTLVSEAGTADAQPATAQIALWEEDVDSVTLNTDIQAFVSSDDGATWDQVTLAELTNLGTGRLLGGTVPLTGGGTAMRWKVTTHNEKGLKLHAAGMLWG